MTESVLQPSDTATRIFATQTDADRFYLQMAFKLRTKSDDPKAQTVLESGVGSVIATPTREIAASANVLPPRLKQAYESQQITVTDEDRYFVIEHAERAALYTAYQSGEDLTGSTIYCTRFPCSDCARAIAWSKIGRLVVPRGFRGEIRWIDAQRAALRILRDAGVVVRYMRLDISKLQW